MPQPEAGSKLSEKTVMPSFAIQERGCARSASRSNAKTLRLVFNTAALLKKGQGPNRINGPGPRTNPHKITFENILNVR